MAEEAPYNLLVLGGEGAWKVDLVEQFMKLSSDEYSRTVAAIDGLPFTIRIREVPIHNVSQGGETDILIYEVEGIILVYSVTSRSSFEEIRNLYNVIQEIRTRSTSSAPDPAALSTAPLAPVRIILVGNGSEAGEGKRAVSVQEGNKLAQDLKCDFFEVSTETQTNVEELLQCLIRQCRRRRREQGGESNLQVGSASSSEWMLNFWTSCAGFGRK